jgi:hypothetical protein
LKFPFSSGAIFSAQKRKEREREREREGGREGEREDKVYKTKTCFRIYGYPVGEVLVDIRGSARKLRL